MTFSRLRGSRAGEEFAHALRRRQRAGEVETDAAQEFGVAGEIGRHDLELAQLGEDKIVDEVVARNCGIVRQPAGPMTPTPALATWPAARTRMEVSPSRLALTTPLAADRGHFAVIDGVERLVREVFGVAVAEVRGDQQPVLPFQRQDRHGRKQFQPRQFGFRRASPLL